jgi:hypothetical protein
VTTARRVNTMRALVAGASCAATLQDVDNELHEIIGATKVQLERRKHLLQILHATRALDTVLGKVLASYGTSSIPHSIGPRLRCFAALPTMHAGHITLRTVHQFNQSICNPRNRYMHNADAFPRSAREADRLISAVEACFVAAVK